MMVPVVFIRESKFCEPLDTKLQGLRVCMAPNPDVSAMLEFSTLPA